MKKYLASVLALLVLPAAAWAYNYPTVDRVEYVLGCAGEHGNKTEYLYKCSCEIDAISKKVPLSQFDELATAHRYQHLGGEKGGEFRDPKDVKTAVSQYDAIVGAARQMCSVN